MPRLRMTAQVPLVQLQKIDLEDIHTGTLPGLRRRKYDFANAPRAFSISPDDDRFRTAAIVSHIRPISSGVIVRGGVNFSTFGSVLAIANEHGKRLMPQHGKQGQPGRQVPEPPQGQAAGVQLDGDEQAMHPNVADELAGRQAQPPAVP